ncbi:MerR family transcriptional regulator [Algibacter sp. L4_22]|uniref:MerR family transcriptional regulator n=1 Tax=Algibacter sp. L4_22 TaxID=2942477 RepID=UPI00201B9796|nr:MerR family transcriptional regulator [Algibacter sp. L4_22]MCL5127664.1 MerR family transcriptional regulator [Algibacter sp. L4_22]
MFNINKNTLNEIKNKFTIKDLENISGIKAHTIRIWEKRYNLLAPKRTDTNIRYYTTESLKKLLNIVLLKDNGYKISKIAEMPYDVIQDTARELANQNAVDQHSIQAFKLAMIQFDSSLFNSTYAKLLQTNEFSEIIKNTFIPLLNFIGLLWQTNTLIPAHEHFISNLITQKILVETERLAHSNLNSSTTYVLFLPENEIHEIGLLYLNYELLLKGLKTIYLGPSLPVDNLSSFFNSESKMCFITSITVSPTLDLIESYFKDLDILLLPKQHKLLAAGVKLQDLKQMDFKSDIKLYPTVIPLLKDL